jgi:hypothetical protein
MTEQEFQNVFLSYLHTLRPTSVFITGLDFRYEIGKYHKGKTLGMPDTKFDIVEFDAQENFHLYELKLIESMEIWTGKFFGQIMLYDYLFSTEPWNELFGRFITRINADKNSVRGEWERLTGHLAFDYGQGEVADDNDTTAYFSSWNLVICGGKGYELAGGFNPVIYSFWTFPELYFKDSVPQFDIYHFYKDNDHFMLRLLDEIGLYQTNGLTEYAKEQFNKDFPDFFKEQFDELDSNQ